MTDAFTVPAVPMAPTAKAVHDAFVEHAIDQFLVTANGILVAAEDGDIPVTAGYANVRAIARDGTGDRWSLVLDWKNQDGDLRTMIVPYARIVGDWSAVMVQLADQGLVVSPKFWGAFRDFLTYAVGTPTIPRYRLLPKIGFFPVDRKNPNGAFGFLWPDEPVAPEGATTEPVLFMPPLPSPVQGAYRAHGDHEEWLQKSQHLANDDLWVAMTCAGFASLLLEAAGLECFGFHIIANTTNGKTTRARAAVGVVGCPALPSESNGEALCSNWTATTNGIELLAIAHSGGPMLLDELGAMPQGVVPNVYGLMQGRSKARMADVGAMRQQYSWKILAVSTGEISLTERLAQEGQRKAMGGELVRLMELHLDHMRPIESLTQEQADARGAYMKQLLADHYGTPGRHFVRALVDEFPDYASLCEALREDVDAAHDGLVDELSRQRPLSPVLRRGLRQFALLRVAGAWAYSAGASPFDGEVVERAVLTTAAAWVDGFAETTEEQRLIASLRAYVFDKQDYFIDCDTADRLAVEAEEWVPGLFHHDGKLWFEPCEFEAACNGIPAKRAGKLLAELGILHRHVGDAQHKTKVTIWPWVFHYARYYAVYANRILSAEELAELCAGSAG